MDNKRLARSGEDPLAVRQMTHADADLRRGRKGNSQGAFTNLEELEGSRLLPVHFAVLHVSQIWVDAVTRCDRRRPKASHTRCASESARCGEKKQSIAPRLFSEGGLPRAFAQTIPQPHRRWLCRAKIECQKHRKALRYNYLTACIEAIKESRALASTKLALEFLILTASRSGEVRHAIVVRNRPRRTGLDSPSRPRKTETPHIACH